MNIIIPMAGVGKRMRPHTLTVPKPLISVAGKTITERLVEEITKVINEKVEQIAFVIGDFGDSVEKELLEIAQKHDAKGKIYYQEEALGTAHAVFCAEQALEGKVIIAFADTLFDADFKLNENNDGTVWVHRVENPESFGVVKTDENGFITEFIEKPQTFVSDQAIIGIYYFREGNILKKEIQYLLENKIVENGEYQITNALENMKQKGVKFKTDKVNEWLDCGNKDAIVHTNKRILSIKSNERLIDPSIVLKNSTIIEPCYIGENVSIEDSVVGPYASIGNNTVIQRCLIKNSIIQKNSTLRFAILDNAMIGNYVEIYGDVIESSIGDYSVWKHRD